MGLIGFVKGPPRAYKFFTSSDSFAIIFLLLLFRLRALSDGNSVGTPPPSPGIPGKYKLAEYRYGREELLALSNTNNIEVPEEVKNFSAIYVEKPLEPISLHNLSEEEQVKKKLIRPQRPMQLTLYKISV